MAINVKKNQALGFNTDLPCQCGGNYCQPWQLDDTIYIQGTSTPATGEDLVKDDMWTLGAGAGIGEGWRINNGILYGINLPYSTTQAMSNDLNMEVGFTYGIYVDATTIKGDENRYYLFTNGFTSSKAFHLLGNVASSYTAGMKIRVIGTANNDKTFTVVGATYDGFTQTLIDVEEDTVAEAGGNIWIIVNPVTIDNIGEGYRIKINGEYLPVHLLSTVTSLPYLFWWFYKPTSITDNHIEIECTDPATVAIINKVDVFLMSRVGIATYQNNSLVEKFDNPTAIVTYYSQDASISNSSGNETLDMPTYLWQAIIPLATFTGTIIGCSQLSFYDSVFTNHNPIINGSLGANLDSWVAGDYWAWDASPIPHAQYTPPSSGAYAPGTLSQQISLLGGLKYTLNFALTGTITGAQVLIKIDDGSSVTLIGSFAPPAHIATIDLTAYTGTVTIDLIFAEAQQNKNIGVRDVSIYAQGTDKLNVSDCINVQTTHDCTLLYQAENNDNAFDFDYTHGMKHNLRVTSKMDVTAYPEADERARFSDNSKLLMYAESDTEYSVFVTDAPIYVHDCLRLLRLHDTFSINGTEYIKESGYELNRRKTSKLKQSTFTVRPAQGISSNYPCS